MARWQAPEGISMNVIACAAPVRGSAADVARGLKGTRSGVLALGVSLALATYGASGALHAHGRHVSQLIPVQNCDDDGPNSLRGVVNDIQTQSGDTIDLSQLSCGTITLSTGAIVVPQSDLSLIGPGAERLTITAGHASRLFDHTAGTLELRALSLSAGDYHASGAAHGGCIRSTGSVYLWRVAVDDCHVSSDAGVAGGGAVSAPSVALVLSTISGSSAISLGTRADGGAVEATQVATIKYSEISGSSAQSTMQNQGGGGALSTGSSGLTGSYALIAHSTIDHNQAICAGAVTIFGTARIEDSTISDNSSGDCAAVEVFGTGVYLANSTIAFNHADQGTRAGLYFKGTGFSATLTAQSSIIANNAAGSPGVPADLHVVAGFVQGLDNLVMSINGPPPAGFVAVDTDPELGPLQWNGGRTRTRALARTSPAIGMGNNLAGLAVDQRGNGYPRTTGIASSVDIGAFQADTIFAGLFEW